MDCVDVVKRKGIERKDLPAVCACISSVMFLVLMITFGTKFTMNIVPVLCAVPVAAYVLTREKIKGPKAEAVMNESPTAIGMMRLMIDGGSSLDSVVREVAVNGPKNIAEMFAKVVWDVDTRVTADIRDSLNHMISSLPKPLAAFKRGMYLIVSATDAKDSAERSRITKDASDTMLEGLKETGESYSSKLNAPCMVIFGLGVMVPMILVSVIPMLTVGGQFSSASLDPISIAVITLLLIPAVVAAVIMVIASKNPFYVRSDEKVTLKDVVPLMLCAPIFVSLMYITNDIPLSMAVSAIASGALLFVALHPKMAKERKKVKIESIMGDALFDLGNRLLSGENFETALTASFKERNDCADLAASLERCMLMSRGDTADALMKAMSPYSERMASLYRDVHRSSMKDLRDAGRLAVSIGHQLQDQTVAMNGIQNKLRSMLDMMTGTSAVFAPLILGISISMLAPLMKLAGGAGMSFAPPILIAYLIELAVLISVLTMQLRCRGGLLTILHTFGMMMPVALVIFLVSSSIVL
ncbi:MAG: hypothetical protein FWD81_05715 [Methanomassiliicoccaceae archaeon]|nr:hypothetical protein [Methanomassiliicoccaceae archaeon]